MEHSSKLWALPLLLLAGFAATSEPSTINAARAEARKQAEQRAALELQELAQERLECRTERKQLLDAIASKQAECSEATKSFQECRARRSELEGAELLGCGVGIAVGLAAGGLAYPWALGECGVAEPPPSRERCPVPACEADPAAMEREVLAEHGLAE